MIRHLGFLLSIATVLSGGRQGQPRIVKCDGCGRQNEPTYLAHDNRRICRLCIEIALAHRPLLKTSRPGWYPVERVPPEPFKIPDSWERQFLQ